MKMKSNKRKSAQIALSTPVTKGGIRKITRETSISNSLNVSRLRHILDQSLKGLKLQEYLQLADEMEERDPHYGGVLGVRKRAVLSLNRQLKSDDKVPDTVYAAVRKLINQPVFGTLLAQQLDALGKGFAVSEIVWQIRAHQWTPVDYLYCNPQWFSYDNAERELRLLTPNAPKGGESLPAYKFVQHEPYLKAGIPVERGLARLSAMNYLCKSINLSHWMSYMETFGVPLRIGKYDQSASLEDIETLKRAISQIGRDAGAIIPSHMQIEFVESAAQSKSSSELFSTLQTFLDKQISKAVLGQTMTTDDGASRAQAMVHNDVRIDIVQSDAQELAESINRYVITPFVQLNFGASVDIPLLQFMLPKNDERMLYVEMLDKLVPLGLKVSQEEVRAHLNIKAPKENEACLQIK